MRILIHMDNPSIQTGYAYTCRLTAKELVARGHEVYAMAFNGGWMPENIEPWYDIKVVPNYALQRDKNAIYGDMECLQRAYNEVAPDVMIFHNDSYRYSYLKDMPNEMREKSIFWLPFEGDVPDKGGLEIFSKCAATRFVTRHAMDVNGPELTGKDIGVIYHAVDASAVMSCTKDEAKRAHVQPRLDAMGRGTDASRTFVVARIDRHQPRKYWNLTLEAFAKFAKGKDDVLLLAKCNPRDITMWDEGKKQGVDLEKLADDLGVRRQVAFDDFFFNPQSLAQSFYWPADVFLTTTSGEGFGLAPAEAISHGVPVIAPDVPVLPEVLGEGAMLCKVKERSWYDKMSVFHNLVDTDDVAAKLESAYQDWKSGGAMLASVAAKGRALALSRYAPKVVYDQWDEVIREVKERNELVSIVTVLYNVTGDEQLTGDDGVDKLRETMEKYVTYPYEWIIVDNGSPERAKTREWLSKAAAGNKRIKPLLLDQNLGFAGANNKAIAMAKGKNVILVNPDGEAINPAKHDLTKDWVRIYVERAESDPSIGIIGMKINERDDILPGARFPYFCSVLITKACLDAVKLADGKWLDEAFWPAYYEDSLDGKRCVPIKNKDGISVIPLEKLFMMGESRMRPDGKMEAILHDVKTLSVNPNNPCGTIDIENLPEWWTNRFLSSAEKKIYLLYKQTKNWRKAARMAGFKTRSGSGFLSNRIRKRIRRSMKEEAFGQWSRVCKVVRHKVMGLVSMVITKHGQTECTNNHSLMVWNGTSLKECRPKEIMNFKPCSVTRINSDHEVDSSCDVPLNTQNAIIEGEMALFGSRGYRFPIRIDYGDMKKSKAFFGLLGDYVSEGSVCKECVSICGTNRKYMDMTFRDFKTLLGRNPNFSRYKSTDSLVRGKRIIHKAPWCYRVCSVNKQIAAAFEAMCGKGSHNKRIPSFVFTAPRELQEAFLSRLFRGDAYRFNKGLSKHEDSYSAEYKDKAFRFGTTSLELASGLCLLLSMMDIRFSTSYDGLKKFYGVDYVMFRKNSKSSPVKVVERIHDGFVYDLEVEGNHTFVDAMGLLVVHNTDFTMRAQGKGFKIAEQDVPFWHKSGGTNKHAIEGGAKGKVAAMLMKDLEARAKADPNGADWGRKRIELEKDGMQGLIEGNIKYLSSKWGEAARKKIRVVWQTHVGEAVGFSELAEGLIPELHKLGFDVYVNDWSNGTKITNPLIRELYEKTRRAKENGDDLYDSINIVCWLMETFLGVEAGYKVGISLCESTKVRESYLQACNSMDRILTFSDFCKRVQVDSGFQPPIHVIPPGVDPVYMRLAKRPAKDFSKDKFTFLNVGVCQERKDTYRLVAAFCEAFPKHAAHIPDGPGYPIKPSQVELVLKSNNFGDLSWISAPRNDGPPYDQRANIRAIFTGQDERAKEPNFSKEKMYELYASADAVVHPSHGEGIGYPICFTRNALVSTFSGPKKISELSVGDLVITHLGRERCVAKTMKRPYDGQLVTIRTLLNNEKFECTPDHPVLVVRKAFPRSNDRRHAALNPTWITAKDVRKGDLMILPRPAFERVDRFINIADWIGNQICLDHDEDVIWSKYSNRPNGATATVISRKSGVSKRQVYRVMQGLSHRSETADYVSKDTEAKIHKAMEELEYEKNSFVCCPKKFEMDYDAGLLIGYYAAEGSPHSTSNISFAFHEDESGYHADVRRLMREKLGADSDCVHRTKNYLKADKPPSKGYEIVFSSTCAQKFLKAMVGSGARTKCLHREVMLANRDFKLGFLRGFWRGDGSLHAGKTASRVTFSTSSAALCHQIWMMVLELGKEAGIQKSTRKGNEEYIVSYGFNGHDEITETEFNPSSRARSFYKKSVSSKQYVMAQVLSIGTRPFSGDVFNVEIQDDNSYCVNGYAVHNCEGAATGCPVIFTNWSSPAEYFNDENSYPISLSPYPNTTFTKAYEGAPGDNGVWANCFVPGTPVRTMDGMKPIEEIKPGDMVLTHRGRYRSVTATMKRPYDGEVVRISGSYNQHEIMATNEHPFLCVKTSRCFRGGRSHVTCKPNCRRKGDACDQGHFKGYSALFTKATNLEPRDALLLPFVHDEERLPRIDVHSFNPSASRDDEFVWLSRPGFFERMDKSRTTIGRIAKEANVSKSVAQRVVSGNGSFSAEAESSVHKAMKKLGYEKPGEFHRIKRFVEIDEPLGRLFGFYLAEGNARCSSVRFCFHAKETEYAEEVLSLMRSKFGIKGSIVKSGKNAQQVCFYSALLVRLFRGLFGNYSYKKRMPSSWMRGPKHFAKGIIYGLWRGDGCIEQGSFSYKTASPKLAYQASNLCLKLGIETCIYKNKIGQYILKASDILNHEDFDRGPRPRTWRDEKYVYLPIKKVSREDYSGVVYNLEVDEDNTYCVANAVVHNCHIGHLKFLMWHVLKEREEALAKGRKAHEHVKANFTWEKSAKALAPMLFEWDADRQKKESRNEFDPLSFVKPELEPVKEDDRVMIDVVTRDRHPYLSVLLCSLLHQTYKNWDLIIEVDDADENILRDHLVMSLLARARHEGHDWRMIRSHRQGPHMAHDRTLFMTHENPGQKYKLLCRVDDDIYLEPDYLGHLFGMFVADKDCEIAAISGTYPDPRRSRESQTPPAGWEKDINYAGKVDHNVPWPYVCFYPEGTAPRLVEHLYSSFMFRVELGVAIGGYCKLFSQIGHREESDFSYRFHLAGYKQYVHPRALGFHFQAPAGGIRSGDIGDNKSELAAGDHKIYARRLAKWKKRAAERSLPPPRPEPKQEPVMKEKASELEPEVASKRLIAVINGGPDVNVLQEAVARTSEFADEVYVTTPNPVCRTKLRGDKLRMTCCSQEELSTLSIALSKCDDYVMTIRDTYRFLGDPRGSLVEWMDDFVFEVYKTYQKDGRVLIGPELRNECLISRRDQKATTMGVDASKIKYCDVMVLDDVKLDGTSCKSSSGMDLVPLDQVEKTTWMKLCVHQFPEGDLNPPRAAMSESSVKDIVSIIIPTAGRLPLLRRCVDSVFSHTSTPFEIIVVDNGSTDGTRDYLEKESIKRPAIRFTRNSINLGFQKAVNMGVAMARGKYVLLFNDDAWVEGREADGRDWLSVYADELEKDPRLGLVGPHAPEGGMSPTLGTPMLFFWCVMTRKETWDKVGPLDDITFFNYGGDDDWCRRLLDKGHTIKGKVTRLRHDMNHVPQHVKAKEIEESQAKLRDKYFLKR